MKKINQLHQQWPRKTVGTSFWLDKAGFSRQLRKSYQKSEWIQSIGYGAFIWKADKIEWKGAVFALQKQLQKSIHVAGKTALELQGYGHFVKFNESLIILFAKPTTVVPKWFTQHSWGPTINVIRSSFLPYDVGLEEKIFDGFVLTVSSPERAILEVLHAVPNQQSFDEAYMLMENLNRLRPKVVQELLDLCSSIKVKRLFLYLAEALQQPWLKHIDISKINLGSGNRSIVKGTLDKKYKITIPKKLVTYE